ncbi:hypothetical protein DXG01_016807 [Tephrocybe rancida]|nr:hypothetical protein DXG01_016807 [Tephrocybe rancida]
MFRNSRNITVHGGTFAVTEQFIHSEPALLNMFKASALGALYQSQEQPDLALHCDAQKPTLLAVSDWSLSDSGRKPILWLHGPSKDLNHAIAYIIARESAQRRELAASFFFSTGRTRCSSIDHFAPTIALQLALSLPRFHSVLARSLAEDPWVTNRAVPVQFETLVLKPLCTITDSWAHEPLLVLIDALDDCEGEENQDAIIMQVARLAHAHRDRLRFIIVSSSAPALRILHKKPQLRAVCVARDVRGMHELQTPRILLVKRRAVLVTSFFF